MKYKAHQNNKQKYKQPDIEHNNLYAYQQTKEQRCLHQTNKQANTLEIQELQNQT